MSQQSGRIGQLSDGVCLQRHIRTLLLLNMWISLCFYISGITSIAPKPFTRQSPCAANHPSGRLAVSAGNIYLLLAGALEVSAIQLWSRMRDTHTAKWVKEFYFVRPPEQGSHIEPAKEASTLFTKKGGFPPSS
jgi:hypothetical protein